MVTSETLKLHLRWGEMHTARFVEDWSVCVCVSIHHDGPIKEGVVCIVRQ